MANSHVEPNDASEAFGRKSVSFEHIGNVENGAHAETLLEQQEEDRNKSRMAHVEPFSSDIGSSHVNRDHGSPF